MSYEEITGDGGGGDYEEREFISVGIQNTKELEGTFRGRLSRVIEGTYGPYRVASFDLTDGRKVAVRASRILLERLEKAGLNDGDGVKIVVEPQPTKDGKKTFGNVRLFVKRGAAPAATPPPQAAPPVSNEEPPF